MSDISEKEINLIKETNTILNKRVEKLNKTFKISVIALSVFVVIVLTYMSFLYAQVRKTFKAETLAEAATLIASDNIPVVGKKLEENLKGASTDILRGLRDRFINDSIPSIRRTIEVQFLEFSGEFINTAADSITIDVYTDIVKRNREDIDAAIQGDTSAITRENIAAVIEDHFQEEMNKQTGAKGEQVTLNSKLNQSVEIINNINTQIKQLSVKQKLTREDMLVKRLLGLWWTFLSKSEEDLKDGGIELTGEDLLEHSKSIISEETISKPQPIKKKKPAPKKEAPPSE